MAALTALRWARQRLGAADSDWVVINHQDVIAARPRCPKVAVGTTWLGFPWPPNKAELWEPPTDEEINSYFAAAVDLLLGPEDAQSTEQLLMIDTAAGYYDAERRLAALFRAKPDLRRRAFVATKCGESRAEDGQVTHDFSAAACTAQIKESMRLLGRIDAVYLHLTGQVGDERSLEVLRDQELLGRLRGLRSPQPSAAGGAQPAAMMIGASISSDKVLKAAMDQGLLVGKFDIIQMSRRCLLAYPDVVRALHAAGVIIAVNSPVRHLKEGQSPSDALRDLASRTDQVDFILTGSRNHLRDVVESCREGVA